MSAADVVVVGAGVIGASVAWHLCRLGLSVVIVDRAHERGAGSTGRATGGFRAQFGTAAEVKLSLRAREKLLAFRDEVGVDPGYLSCGYLWLARSGEDLKRLRQAHAVQQAAGLREARLLAPGEIAAHNRFASLDGVLGAAFCPLDGFIRPLQLLNGYLDAAVGLGARLELDAELLGFSRDAADRLCAVRTSRGDFPCATVVNAAGPWAAAVARAAGVELPVVPLRRQVAATVPTRALPDDLPLTIWLDDGFHLRVRDGRVLLLLPSPGATDPFDASVEPHWLERVRAIAGERVPALRGAAIDASASWGGLYEMSPDARTILGPAPGRPDLFLCNGSSGHGVMHAPALGELAAAWIASGKAPDVDVAALDPGRFAAGVAPGGSLL